MKATLIIFGVILFLFVVVQIYSLISRNNIESYPYSVVKSYEQFEIRKYESSLFTSVKLPTDKYENASGQGFSVLAGYIFGANDRNEKISMTSPVSISLEDSMTMKFLIPDKFGKDQLPKPNSTEIEIVQEDAKTVAAIEFGGWASTKKIEKYKKRLIDQLEANNILYKNEFHYFGYNPPFDILFRRNEIIVELQ